MTVEVKNVSKTYGTKHALKSVSLTIEEDKIYGLLGRNGAGKTSLMQVVAGHLLPTKGNVLIKGEQPFNNRDVLQQICMIYESGNYNKRLKIKQVLKIASLFYPNWCQQTAVRLLQEFNLDPSMKAKGLSKGMEASLGIVIGLASRSKITIFDEPYIGLDAAARYRFYDVLLEEYEDYPRTIILSTHLIDEVSNLFEEVIIMKGGEVLLQKNTEKLLADSMQISRKKEVIDSFVTGKQVLHETEIMGMKTVLIYDPNMTSEQAKALGLKVERCNVQQLMVYLTEQKGVS
ncbi:ABC transporter ATP-binding protein [Bacillus alkalicellulosilyticus]|uniref:ABC transporter ATP-binding protein n=1 Tax=Alkalihalobacterium alkalicellulosilyticum TaxID=1912214 RepID=UPI000998A885|nr:ABC transporter ATP-binding protein [Bacillus alkalicellulosilyticus]